MRQMYTNRQILLQLVILILSNLLITSVTIFISYNQSIKIQEKSLTDIVNRQLGVISELSREGKDENEILTFLKEIHSIGKSGEFTIAHILDDSVKYLLANGEKPNFRLDKNPQIGYPMRLALSGKSGFVKANDYKGIKVFGAYTFFKKFHWGIVAKIPVSEINRSYIIAALASIIISFILLGIWILLFRKISDPLLQKIIDSEETYRTLFSSINDAVLVSTLNPDGTIGNFIQVNDIACQRLGYTQKELLNLKPTDIHSPRSKATGLLIVEKLKNEQKAIFEIEHVAKDGKVILVEINSRLTKLKDKTIIHSISRDISERKKMEEKLQQNMNLMQMTQKMAKIGGWEWNLQEDSMYWTDETYRIHEADPEKISRGSENHISESLKCYPSDYLSIINEHFNRCVKFGESYDLESPFTTFQGKKIWIRTAGQAEWQDGKIIKVIGTLSDITEQKQSEIMLKEKAEEIESQNEEYKQINGELFLAKQKAEENDRLKTAFLQNVSHEIRTPMNAIMGFSELLSDNFGNKEKLEEYSGIINLRCSDLLELINEILDIAKIESGQLDIHMEEFSLNDMFGEMLVLFKELQKKYNKPNIRLSIRNQITNIHTLIFTDKIKLKQILINLISNALKFTEEGQIEIGCKTGKNNVLTFYVADTGVGIPKDKHDFIFERFTQLKNERKAVYRGTGLGLSIVSGLVNLMEGKIWLESEINQGSTFYFSIACKLTSGSLEPSNYDNKNKAIHFTGQTILLVEDDIFNANYLKEVLSGRGLDILHAATGNEAIEITHNQKLDLVLLDIGLPDINGYEVCKAMLQIQPNVKVIAQTAYAAVSDREKALTSGCLDFLSKPLKKKDIFATLQKYLVINQHYPE